MYERSLLGLKEAQEAIQVMIKEVESKKDDYWQHGVFAIVDFAGSLIAFARMDGAHEQGAFMAVRKAYTAALWAMSTSEFREVVRAPMDVSCFGDKFTLSKGGVPIIPPYARSRPVASGETEVHTAMIKKSLTPYCVGAIGVGNCGPGEKDEEVAMIGAKYLESVLWPSK